MYPPRFQRPIPLKDWMASKGFGAGKTAKHFADGAKKFIPAAIQKMIVNPDRDVGVQDETLVETVQQEVVGVFVEGRHIATDKIIFIKPLKPFGPMGSNPNAKRRGPAPRAKS